MSDLENKVNRRMQKTPTQLDRLQEGLGPNWNVVYLSETKKYQITTSKDFSLTWGVIADLNNIGFDFDGIEKMNQTIMIQFIDRGDLK